VENLRPGAAVREIDRPAAVLARDGRKDS